MKLTCTKTEKMRYVVALTGLLEGCGFKPCSDVDVRNSGVVMAFYEATIYNRAADVPGMIPIHAVSASDSEIGTACMSLAGFEMLCSRKVTELVGKFQPAQEACGA